MPKNNSAESSPAKNPVFYDPASFLPRYNGSTSSTVLENQLLGLKNVSVMDFTIKTLESIEREYLRVAKLVS